MPYSAKQIDDLIAAMLDDTLMMSSSSATIANEHFQALLDLGKYMQHRVIERMRSGEIQISFFYLLTKSTGYNPVQPQNRGYVEKMREDWLAWVDQKAASALRTEIIYLGKPALVICDLLCEKAWGVCARPTEEFDPENNPDDCAFFADSEFDTAPSDPETYEGGHGKPFHPTKHNKWCARQCERSDIIVIGEVEAIPLFEQRCYNIPRNHDIKCASEIAIGGIYVKT